MDRTRSKIMNIVWDWNGTLLDDVNLCVESINTLLTIRKIPNISVITYKEIFDFPVKGYYERAGFDFTKEAFEKPAIEFIELYDKNKYRCKLSPQGFEVMRHFQSIGHRQFILSASESGVLKEMMIHHKLNTFLNGTYGLDDHYANGKSALATKMEIEQKLDPSRTILVGDTCHDAAVAAEKGWRSILYTRGHHPREKLITCSKSTLIDNLDELVDLVI